MRMYRSHGSPRPTSRELLLWYSKPNFHHRNRHPVRSRSVSHIVVCGEYHVLRNPQKPAKNARSAFGATHRASESERGRVIEFWSSTQKREGGLLASCVYVYTVYPTATKRRRRRHRRRRRVTAAGCGGYFGGGGGRNPKKKNQTKFATLSVPVNSKQP